jgi:hypothetical protein
MPLIKHELLISTNVLQKCHVFFLESAKRLLKKHLHRSFSDVAHRNDSLIQLNIHVHGVRVSHVFLVFGVECLLFVVVCLSCSQVCHRSVTSRIETILWRYNAAICYSFQLILAIIIVREDNRSADQDGLALSRKNTWHFCRTFVDISNTTVPNMIYV